MTISVLKLINPNKFVHTQTTPATVWDITYLFPGLPIVDVLVDISGNLEKIIPKSVEIVSSTEVKIHFSIPYSGKAFIVS